MNLALLPPAGRGRYRLQQSGSDNLHTLIWDILVHFCLYTGVGGWGGAGGGAHLQDKLLVHVAFGHGGLKVRALQETQKELIDQLGKPQRAKDQTAQCANG